MSQKTTSTELPFVSVVIPVYNSPSGLERTLKNLQQQTYPQDKWEIIVVDNCSTENNREIATRYSCTFLQENRMRNSYAARNTGIRSARGSIIAFIDADCVPVKNWLEEGIKTMQSTNAEIVGGNIQFTFEKKIHGIAEMADSIVFLQQEKYVKFRKSACTANLFISKSVFDSLGLFPEKAASSIDVYFTANAVKKGRTIAFAPKATIHHQARSLQQLMGKALRIGTGKGTIVRQENLLKTIASALKFIKELSPVQRMKTPFLLSKLNPWNLWQTLKKNHQHVTSVEFFGILACCYAMAIVGGIGVIRGLLFGKKHLQNRQ